MNVAGCLLVALEEFFEEISRSELRDNPVAAAAIEELRQNVEIQYDGAGDLSDLALVENSLGELEWIWRSISQAEKTDNDALGGYYEELHEHLEFMAKRAEQDESWEEFE